MPARIRLGGQFLRDFRHQEAWLVERGEIEWLHGFDTALERLKAILTRFPESGSTVRSGRRHVLRELTFPRGLPYVVYYVHLRRRPVREVRLLRLFHHAQQRPRIDFEEEWA